VNVPFKGSSDSDALAFIIMLITVVVKEFNASASTRDVTKSLDEGKVDRVLVLDVARLSVRGL